MGNGNVRDGESGQNSLLGTKRFPRTGKRFPQPQSTTWVDKVGKQVDETEAGASGDYVVALAEEDKLVRGAISIRVLKNGELNFLTDEGHWILFASGTWKHVFPKQPSPGERESSGQRPYAPNAAQ
jgi:hypothetical protein